MKSLIGKVALITGASAPHGIGRAIALRLAQEGASVVVSDIAGTVKINGELLERAALLTELSKDITNAGGIALPIILDVTDAENIATCMQTIITQFSRIDILVNNAGSLSGSDNFLSTTPQQWQSSFQVNLLGPMMLSQAVIPEMCKMGGGRIINIGSTGSLGAEAGFGAYTTMKHGLVGLSKTIAAEFGPDNILCNTVCPGYIMTDMHAAANQRLATENECTVDDVKQSRYANVALRHAGLPEDVAEAVTYLAGPAANYVTGISLPVSGGVPFGL